MRRPPLPPCSRSRPRPVRARRVQPEDPRRDVRRRRLHLGRLTHLVAGDYRLLPVAPPLAKLLAAAPLCWPARAPTSPMRPGWRRPLGFRATASSTAGMTPTASCLSARLPIVALAALLAWGVFSWTRKHWGLPRRGWRCSCASSARRCWPMAASPPATWPSPFASFMRWWPSSASPTGPPGPRPRRRRRRGGRVRGEVFGPGARPDPPGARRGGRVRRRGRCARRCGDGRAVRGRSGGSARAGHVAGCWR